MKKISLRTIVISLVSLLVLGIIAVTVSIILKFV